MTTLIGLVVASALTIFLAGMAVSALALFLVGKLNRHFKGAFHSAMILGLGLAALPFALFLDVTASARGGE